MCQNRSKLLEEFFKGVVFGVITSQSIADFPSDNSSDKKKSPSPTVATILQQIGDAMSSQEGQSQEFAEVLKTIASSLDDTLFDPLKKLSSLKLTPRMDGFTPAFLEEELMTLTANALTACTLDSDLRQKYVTAFELLYAHLNQLLETNPPQDQRSQCESMMRYLFLLIGHINQIPTDSFRQGLPEIYLETFDMMVQLVNK